jgi:hypothetical protein
MIIAGETQDGARELGPVDRVVVATGQRPNLTLTRELRVDLDPWLESAKALGPLIDPNLHSCGSVPPHGHRELAHPEPGFYTVGIKSYGRAPTFLMLTGYEQVRSVAAALAGDMAAADDIPSGSAGNERVRHDRWRGRHPGLDWLLRRPGPGRFLLHRRRESHYQRRAGLRMRASLEGRAREGSGPRWLLRSGRALGCF